MAKKTSDDIFFMSDESHLETRRRSLSSQMAYHGRCLVGATLMLAIACFSLFRLVSLS